ncbi:MAG: Sec-independent protein translocase subunit TatA [Frankiaceae bacterium]|nr:Sec-independent protein translocase subunit TatA [Frankiaceae bacterium]MBV9869543.1 Sec-independent protein translocase subunit TatA [Frankiaceae bacterium]
MGEFSPWHLLIVAAVFLVLFGAKKLPDFARSLGKSARILKTELKDLHEDDKPAEPAAIAAVPVVTEASAPVVTEASAQPTTSDQAHVS